MGTKRIWVTSLTRDEARVQGVMAGLKRYGLAPDGHFWVDDLPRVAWYGVADDVAGCDGWLILCDAEAMARVSVRQGLSLLALAVAHRRHLPVWVLGPNWRPGTLLADAQHLDETGSWPVKVVAGVNRPGPAPQRPYRLNSFGDAQVGCWLEVGPAAGTWSGALLGVDAGEIDQHAVGRPGKLPDRCTVEYAMKGLRLESGGTEYTAWALKNHLGEDDSYFVRVRGDTPSAIAFGPMDEEQPGLWVVKLA